MPNYTYIPSFSSLGSMVFSINYGQTYKQTNKQTNKQTQNNCVLTVPGKLGGLVALATKNLSKATKFGLWWLN